MQPVPVTEGDGCPLGAAPRADCPEVTAAELSVSGAVKAAQWETRTPTSTTRSAFPFLLLLFWGEGGGGRGGWGFLFVFYLFPAKCNWHFLGWSKPGHGADGCVIKEISELIRMENSQECKIRVGFGSS